MRPDENVEILYRKEQYLTAPVEAGEYVGEISYLVDGRVWHRERLIAAKDVEAIDLIWCGRQILLTLSGEIPYEKMTGKLFKIRNNVYFL